MPDLSYLLSRWWKQIVLIVLLSVATVAIVLMLKPTRYLSVATAVPASTYASDKGSVFNSNMQNLYPSLGTPDDLDMVLGTAQLDTVYISVAQQLDLASHYKVEEKGQAAILKAGHIAKSRTRVLRSEYNNLKVKAWDANKDVAALIANAVMGKLQAIHTDLQSTSNKSVINGLEAGKIKLQASLDTLIHLAHTPGDLSSTDGQASRRLAITDQVQQYEKLINQYQLMVDNKSPALIIIENARPASWPDRPPLVPLFGATLFLSILFALGVAIILERRRKL